MSTYVEHPVQFH